MEAIGRASLNTPENFTETAGETKRRKSSAWSLPSGDTGSRRSSIMSLFRRGSKDESRADSQ